jgi:hypothetical protein
MTTYFRGAKVKGSGIVQQHHAAKLMPSNRLPLDPAANAMGTITRMVEGHLGAARVLAELYDGYGLGALMAMIDLDDMNMRGEQIWIAFKEWCREDLHLFITKVTERDPLMVECVNKFIAHPKAVCSGGSWR